MLKTYLVSAPVPGGQYGEAQSHAGPGEVSGDGISEQVHGVGPWQVAGAVGDNLTGHRYAVHALQVFIPANLVKSYSKTLCIFFKCIFLKKNKQTAD